MKNLGWNLIMKQGTFGLTLGKAIPPNLTLGKAIPPNFLISVNNSSHAQTQQSF
jgi:hypothetical protein